MTDNNKLNKKKKMMKTIKHTMLLMAAAALTSAVLTGCSGDEELPAGTPDMTDTPIHITASVNGHATTRAGYEAGDEPMRINMDILQKDENYNWIRVDLLKTGGVWTPVNMPEGGQLLWCSSAPGATVRAYGFSDGNTTGETAFNSSELSNYGFQTTQITDQSTPEGVRSFEFLYCYKENVNPDADGSLNLDFNHVFSKLVINYTYGTELDGSSRQLTSCTVGEVISTKVITPNNGQLEISDGINATPTYTTVTACVDEEAQTVECILLPQTFTTRPTAMFTVTIDGEERKFACEVPTDALEQNTLYTMNVKIGRDKAESTEMRTIKRQMSDD